MSIGRTNSGAGGSLSPNRITIHVNAPKGSTLTFSLGGNVVKTILPDKALLNSDGITADYYYAPSATGTYTVTASLGSLSPSKTVTVSSAGEYDVTIKFLLLYDYGNEFTDITGGWLFSQNSYPSASLTKNDDNMVLYVSRSSGQNAANGCVYTANAIDYTSFSTVKYLYDLAITGSSDADQCSFVARTTAPTNGGYETSDPYTANLQVGTNKTGSCNISSATSPFYTAIRAWSIISKAAAVTATIKRIWLE